MKNMWLIGGIVLIVFIVGIFARPIFESVIYEGSVNATDGEILIKQIEPITKFGDWHFCSTSFQIENSTEHRLASLKFNFVSEGGKSLLSPTLGRFLSKPHSESIEDVRAKGSNNYEFFTEAKSPECLKTELSEESFKIIGCELVGQTEGDCLQAIRLLLLPKSNTGSNQN